jgi:tol-pal system protein YbgF
VRRSYRFVAAACVALSGCALKGDVRRVERELLAMRAETARADSARAVELQRVIAMLDAVQDSLTAQQRWLTVMRGDVRSDLTEIQRQLVQVQELTGQSQQRLSEMRTQLERRAEQQTVPPASGAGGDTAAAALPSADQLYDLGVQQLRRGSPQAARAALRQLLEAYPTHERVPDALFFVGESWAASNPDSAAAAYESVVRRYPKSSRAATSLYKLGLMAERHGDRAAARGYYQRVLADYPRSDEAGLAREKLKTP